MPNPFPTSPLSEDTAQETRWLWAGRIPLEALTSFQGDGGAGKSTLLRWLAARVTAGDLPGDLAEPGNVLWLNIEEHAGRDIRPGLNRQGADVARVYRPNGRGRASIIRFPQHLDRLRDTVIARSARLVVIDQANAFFASNRDQDIRESMLVLREISEENNCGIILNRNLNGSRSADPYRRGRGGGLIVDICRAAYHLGVHPDDDPNGRRVLVSIKHGNISGAATRALLITEGVDRRLLIGEEIDLDAATLLPQRSCARGEGQEPSYETAVAWLRERLADREVPTSEVEAEAARRGIRPRTLERARGPGEGIGVLHRRVSVRNPNGSTTQQTVLRLPGFIPPAEGADPEPVSESAAVLPTTSEPARVAPVQPCPPRMDAADDASIRFALLEMDLVDGVGGLANPAPLNEESSPPTPPAPPRSSTEPTDRADEAEE